jgi:Fe-coproporphyrin III synthase
VSLASELTGTRSGFLPERVIHLHPTRLCNLACKHCYSESDRRRTSALEPEALCRALTTLQTEGYRVVSLSGGEPLVYRHLDRVVAHAQAIGLRVNMISNGILADERRLPLLAKLDALAISFDGLPSTHNALRGRHDAWERAADALERLTARGIPVAAAVALARSTIPELPELALQLVSRGARALQVRPIAPAGRARALAASSFCSDTDLARLYLVAQALRQELEVPVHCDAVPAAGLYQQRSAYAALLASESHPQLPLSELVNPLVITDSAVLKPIAYDFHDRFAITGIDHLTPEKLQHYKSSGIGPLRALVEQALSELAENDGFIDWFDHCTRLSTSWAASKRLRLAQAAPAG